jgi:hypothetical protein
MVGKNPSKTWHVCPAPGGPDYKRNHHQHPNPISFPYHDALPISHPLRRTLLYLNLGCPGREFSHFPILSISCLSIHFRILRLMSLPGLHSKKCVVLHFFTSFSSNLDVFFFTTTEKPCGKLLFTDFYLGRLFYSSSYCRQ